MSEEEEDNNSFAQLRKIANVDHRTLQQKLAEKMDSAFVSSNILLK